MRTRGAWSRRLAVAVGIAAAVALIALALLLLLRRDAAWARIRDTGVWRVGMDPSFPPFENIDADGRLAGLDVDLANAIAARWGVRVEFVGAGFDELIDAVAAHRVDSAISALPVFEHRTREVRFSEPYVEAGVVLAVPRESAIQRSEELAGRRVAVEWGSEGDAQARALQRRQEGGPALVLRDSVAGALDAVLAGEADAALVDAISLAMYAQSDALRTAGAPLASDPYVIVVAADAADLLSGINEALAALEADGTLERIRARWLRP